MERMMLSKAQPRKRKKAMKVMAVLGLMIVFVIVVSMNTGYTRLPPIDLLKVILGQGSAEQNLILFEFRLPRIVISVLIGAGLAVSGCVLQ